MDTGWMNDKKYWMDTATMNECTLCIYCECIYCDHNKKTYTKMTEERSVEKIS